MFSDWTGEFRTGHREESSLRHRSKLGAVYRRWCPQIRPQIKEIQAQSYYCDPMTMSRWAPFEAGLRTDCAAANLVTTFDKKHIRGQGTPTIN